MTKNLKTKLIYLKSVLKCDSFDVAIDIKLQFFRVLVTIEPGHSLLQFVYHELFDFLRRIIMIIKIWIFLMSSEMSRIQDFISGGGGKIFKKTHKNVFIFILVTF